MNKIIIKHIAINNLYGYAKMEYNFEEIKTVICEKTGNGKTSILNAVLFALGFGKSNYQPTIDGYKIKDLESSVDLLLNVNGLDYTLKVESTQKWKVVNKETEIKELVGNELKYTFDGVNCKLTVYKEKISSLFGISYDTIEMLVDIKYFNTDTTKWKWNNRREFIFDLLDVDKQTKGLATDTRFNLIAGDLVKDKTEIEIQKILNTEKKGIEDTKKRNAVIIATKKEELVDLSTIDFDSLEKERVAIKQEIDSLGAKTQDLAIVNEKSRLNAELQELKLQLRQINQKNETEKYGFHNVLADYARDVATKERELQIYTDKVNRIKSDIEDCNIEISMEKEKVFDNEKAICPTCKRPLEADTVAKLKEEFAKSKEYTIARLSARQSQLALNLEPSQVSVDKLTNMITILKNEMVALESKGYTIISTQDLLDKIQAKETEIENVETSNIEIDYKELKNNLQLKYDNVVKEIGKKDRIAQLKEEIANIDLENKELSKQESIRQQKVEQLKNYILAKVELASDIVNAKFNGVEFKLFSLNGALAENLIEPTCVVMLNGVEYEKQSNGQKIYSDICVAKTLRELKNIDLFMFIDEKQSMTLPYSSKYQTVELVTSDVGSINAIRIKDIYTINDTIKGD